MTATVSVTEGSGASQDAPCVADNSCFTPADVTIDVGGEVTWSNDDTAAHTVTSGDLNVDPGNLGTIFDSGLFMAGNVFSHQFDSPGEYPYFCMVHPWMTGVINVIPSTSTQTPSISVYTQSGSYKGGDTIQIFGEVKNQVSTIPVSLRIISPNGNIVTIDQVDADRSGKFSTSIYNTEGALWNLSGAYTVEVSYGLTAQNTATATTTFSFIASTPSVQEIIMQIGHDTNPQKGKSFSFYIEFFELFGSVEHVNYDIIGKQDGRIILELSNVHSHSGSEKHTTAPLPSDSEVFFTVVFQGIGLEPPFSGPIGQTALISVTPEKQTPSYTPTPTSSTTQVLIPQGTSVLGCEPYSCYSPYLTSVKVGSTVTWTNMDNAVHTVTSGNLNTDPDSAGSLFDSSLINSKRGYSYTFSRAGIYDYFCMVHPWMTGQVIVGSGGLITPTNPSTPSGSSLSVSTNREYYRAGNSVDVSVKLGGVGSGQNIGIAITDPNGNNLVSRTITTDSSGIGDLQFKLSENSVSGSYKIIATASVAGQSIQDTTSFTVQSLAGNVSIVSIQPTDQNGNLVSLFNKGKMGFVKVVLSSDSGISSLVTVNLFDSDQTSLGVGSFKTTLGSGQSEMIISFFIPNDANFGTSDIYANVFSDWPSRGGTPLTGESVARVTIR